MEKKNWTEKKVKFGEKRELFGVIVMQTCISFVASEISTCFVLWWMFNWRENTFCQCWLSKNIGE